MVCGGWSFFKREPQQTCVEVVPKVAQGLELTINSHLHHLLMVTLHKILEGLLPILLNILQGSLTFVRWLSALQVAYEINGKIGKNADAEADTAK